MLCTFVWMLYTRFYMKVYACIHLYKYSACSYKCCIHDFIWMYMYVYIHMNVVYIYINVVHPTLHKCSCVQIHTPIHTLVYATCIWMTLNVYLHRNDVYIYIHMNVTYTIVYEFMRSRRALATCLQSPRVCERMTRLDKTTICSTHTQTHSLGGRWRHACSLRVCESIWPA